MTVLSGEFGLAACFGGLVVVVLGLYEERSLHKKLVSILAVVIWLFPVFFVPPALSAGSIAATLSSISTLMAGLIIFPLVLDGFFVTGILAPDSLIRLGLLPAGNLRCHTPGRRFSLNPISGFDDGNFRCKARGFIAG
jgi:hypothetical protein